MIQKLKFVRAIIKNQLIEENFEIYGKLFKKNKKANYVETKAYLSI